MRFKMSGSTVELFETRFVGGINEIILSILALLVAVFIKETTSIRYLRKK